jgi:hypothetical protein
MSTTTPEYVLRAAAMVRAAYPSGVEPIHRVVILRAFYDEFSFHTLTELAEHLWSDSEDPLLTTLHEMYVVARLDGDGDDVLACKEAMIPFGFLEFMKNDEL